MNCKVRNALKERNRRNSNSIGERYSVFIINWKKVIVINRSDFKNFQRKKIFNKVSSWSDFKRKYEIY
ncbi:MAG: hypothetical protein LBN95_07035 [Prevotellaceae bacterium]|nr:hypothetical protein [Prevotellaceae bacterium]